MTGAQVEDGASGALELALRALHHHDRSRAELDARLEQAGVDSEMRADTLAQLAAAGYLNDARYAEQRAEALAARGAGDELIAADLDARGVAADHRAAALGGLAPELERAEAVMMRRGASERTFRYLASRGFAEETLEALIAEGGRPRVR